MSSTGSSTALWELLAASPVDESLVSGWEKFEGERAKSGGVIDANIGEVSKSICLV
jgi:hypothetical protein